MLQQTEYIKSRLEIIAKDEEETQYQIRRPSTEMKAKDPVVQLLAKYQQLEKELDDNRVKVFKTLKVSEAKDGSCKFLPFDLPAFRAISQTIEDDSQKLMKLEAAIGEIEAIGAPFLAELDNSIRLGDNAVRSIKTKLDMARNSTRVEDMKPEIKKLEKELTVAEAELKKLQDTKADITKILSTIEDIC